MPDGAVVCLHGVGRTPSDWAAVRAGLEAFGPVRSPTLPRARPQALASARAAVEAGAGAAPAVLVGHSMGGLVVQRALARYAARAGVLVAPVPAQPAVYAYLRLLRRHPGDALAMLAGRSLPMRPEYLFRELDAAEAARHSDRCGEESALAQYQLIFHRPAPQPLGGAPVLVLESPDDELLPASSIRATARRYGAELVEFPGMGHDLMLDARWKQPLQAMLDFLARL